MKDQVVDIVKSYWARRLPRLVEQIAETARQIDNIMVLEDYYRTARTDEKLNKAVGMFGSEAIDLSSLSAVLQRSGGAQGLQKERYGRMQSIAGDLQALRAAHAAAPPACAFVDLGEGAEAVLERFEAHIGGSARTFRLLRIARLEAKAKYEHAVHDAFFEQFNWRQFDANEMSLCPPFVVLATPDERRGRNYGELLELLTSGKPLNVVLLHDALEARMSETGRAAALGTSTGIELMFIALRSLFVAQGSGAGTMGIDALLERGLASPRPAVVSLYTANGADSHAPQSAVQALRSRAFPHFVYDPDRAPNFVACLDLSQNPELEAGWLTETLQVLPPEGKELQTLERRFTFADFAVGEPAFAHHFTPLAAAEHQAQPTAMAAYLELTPAERRERTPVVYTVDAQNHLASWVPSQAMIAQTADRLHLWHSLQELGGIHNPFVQQAERRLQEALTAEKERALSEMRQTLDAQLQEREQQAVAAAMQRLALNLTGMMASPAVAPTAVAPAAQPAAPAIPAASPAAQPAATPAAAAAPVQVSATPWIDERLCTTCDDCMAINKKIFAYNANKKAYIKDARGGPYKDIVRAAEKCASDAIHPGLPLDKTEKDLDKWIKRAEPYQ